MDGVWRLAKLDAKLGIRDYAADTLQGVQNMSSRHFSIVNRLSLRACPTPCRVFPCDFPVRPQDSLAADHHPPFRMQCNLRLVKCTVSIGTKRGSGGVDNTRNQKNCLAMEGMVIEA
jgi:hypothetical protein